VHANALSESLVCRGTRLTVAVEMMPVIPAEIVTDLLALTDAEAVAVKVVLVAPAAICTDAGMLSSTSLDESTTLVADPEA